MKCLNCHSEQPPSERGPYKTRFAGMAVFLVCPDCDHGFGCLPVPADAAVEQQGPERVSRGCVGMPRYRPGFSDDDYARLKAAMRQAGQGGPFTADDALWQALEAGITNNAGDVSTIFGDLTDLGYLRRLDSDPPRWELS